MYKKLILLVTLLLFISINIVYAKEQTIIISGTIVNKNTKEYVKDVMIKQKDSLNTTFSDNNGNFKILLLNNYPLVLNFSKSGYEPISLEFVESNSNLTIELKPLIHYQSALPLAHIEIKEENNNLFKSQINGFYQIDYSIYNINDKTIQGIVFNQLGLDLGINFTPYVLRSSIYRSRIPINVQDFLYNPAFYTNILQFNMSLGKVWDLNEDKQLYLGPELIVYNYSPDNKNVQDKKNILYTNTSMDIDQLRLALGLNATLAWKLNNLLSVYPKISLYPLGLNYFNDDSNIKYTAVAEAGLKIKFMLTNNLFLHTTYTNQLWLGLGIEDNNFINVGLGIESF